VTYLRCWRGAYRIVDVVGCGGEGGGVEGAACDLPEVLAGSLQDCSYGKMWWGGRGSWGSCLTYLGCWWGAYRIVVVVRCGGKEGVVKGAACDLPGVLAGTRGAYRIVVVVRCNGEGGEVEGAAFDLPGVLARSLQDCSCGKMWWGRRGNWGSCL